MFLHAMRLVSHPPCSSQLFLSVNSPEGSALSMALSIPNCGRKFFQKNPNTQNCIQMFSMKRHECSPRGTIYLCNSWFHMFAKCSVLPLTVVRWSGAPGSQVQGGVAWRTIVKWIVWSCVEAERLLEIDRGAMDDPGCTLGRWKRHLDLFLMVDPHVKKKWEPFF